VHSVDCPHLSRFGRIRAGARATRMRGRATRAPLCMSLLFLVLSVACCVSASRFGGAKREREREEGYDPVRGFTSTKPLQQMGAHVTAMAEMVATALAQPLSYVAGAAEGYQATRHGAPSAPGMQCNECMCVFMCECPYNVQCTITHTHPFSLYSAATGERGSEEASVEMGGDSVSSSSGYHVLDILMGKQRTAKHTQRLHKEKQRTARDVKQLQEKHEHTRAHRRAVHSMAAGDLEVEACEGESRTFACVSGLIQIQSGFWGRSNGRTCASENMDDLSCSTSNAERPLADVCDGKKSCSVRAFNSFFGGDPCEGTSKYMKVVYQCVDESLFNVTRSTASNSSAFGGFNYDREAYGKVFSCAPSFVDGTPIVAEAGKGVLTSQFDTQSGYGAFWECNFLISPQGAEVDGDNTDFAVLLAFDYLETGSSPFECRDCACDYIEVFDGPSPDPRYRLGGHSDSPDDGAFPRAGRCVYACVYVCVCE
jgi:hypothetical protein